MDTQPIKPLGLEVGFSCTQCGGCCDSAPRLSLTELFRHQHRFIGCLSLRQLGRGQSRHPGLARPNTTLDTLAKRLAHAAVGREGPVLVLLAAQAFQIGDDRCPALTEHGRCSLQTRGKPLECQSVPLEAALPDALQYPVLSARDVDARRFGANCLALREPRRLPLLWSEGRVIAAGPRRAVRARRRDLQRDKLFWGNSVFELLQGELFSHPDRVSRLPIQGHFAMSLAPALVVLSGVSRPVRRRVLEYLDAQVVVLTEALASKAPNPSPQRRQLASMLRANLGLESSLERRSPHPGAPPARARAVERWLGIGEETAGRKALPA